MLFYITIYLFHKEDVFGQLDALPVNTLHEYQMDIDMTINDSMR